MNFLLAIIYQLFAEGVPRDESRGDYSTIFTELEANNYCFSIIAKVIIRATVFSFTLIIFSSETSRNCAVATLKISATDSIIIILHWVIIAR